MRMLSALAVVPFLLLVGCTSSSSTTSPNTNTSKELTVFAASSLTAAFGQIGSDFEAANPGVHVTFSFGPSDGLAGQIESEGTADVFASASPTWMDDVSKKVGVSSRADFAQNKLVVITPLDDPGGIKTFADLANPGVELVLAAEGVPVGDYARQALDTAGISRGALANVVSNEQDDASVVAKIAGGEADAGVVYASDLTAAVAPTVRAVPVPADVNVIATYPIAVVDGSGDSALAGTFVSYVTGSQGRATLKSFGLLPPP